MKYHIIYCDPPWSYDNSQFLQTEKGKRGKVTSSAQKHYPTMTEKQLVTLPISELSEDNSLCFMWTSSPHLAVAIRVMEAWGFKYKTVAFCWDKQRENPSSYTLSRVELCLVGKRGTIPKPRGARNVKQFLSEPITTHSKKPDEIRNRIKRMFPEQTKIELFARNNGDRDLFNENPLDGWDAWGNEVKSDIIL